jgi:hypothetical protein
MQDDASPTAPMPTDPSPGRADGCVCGAAEARTARHLRTLEDLAEIGMDLARTVQRQAHERAVTPDWSLWEDEDWAIEEAAAQPRGSPYATRDPDPGSGDPGGDPPDTPPPEPPRRTH